MADTVRVDDNSRLSLLIVTQGQWGERMAENISQFCPGSWDVERLAIPRVLPPIIDDPDDYLPPKLSAVDLVIALGETAGVAQLIPDIVTMTGAKSVIAPIDRNESLPPGLVRQLKGWLADPDITIIFPKPFCSLTETTYNQPPIVVEYDDPIIREFARHFGMPQFQVEVNAEGHIETVQIERDTACGCARAVAEGLAGCPVTEAEHKAGMLHHHFPCLASMNQDADYCDTLMHVSGHILRETIHEQIREHLEPVPYYRPMGRVEDENPST